MIELRFPGRPVAWARPRRGRNGKFFTAEKQARHLRDLVIAMTSELAQKPTGAPSQMQGPVMLEANFMFGGENGGETWLRVSKIDAGRTKRSDLDNLVKQVAEALQAANVLADDAQIAFIVAKKEDR